MMFWMPDWPVVAALRAADLDPTTPLALIEKGLVFASSATARAEGVIRGLRLREAQARCTALRTLPYEPALDARIFEPVIRTIEDLTPGVQLLRPGLCSVRAQGPARYYGSENQAAHAVLRRVSEEGVADARVGIADSIFAAKQAATRAQPGDVYCVAPGGSAAFLAPLPVSLLGVERVVTLLARLGIRSLGDFAALSAADVETRFGPEGTRLHAMASGHDRSVQLGRTPPPELTLDVEFEPALDRVDEIAFTIRARAEQFIQALTERGLACTGITVTYERDDGSRSERTWLHPRTFTAAEVVDRVRWQLEGHAAGSATSEENDTIDRPTGVNHLTITPSSVDSLAHHEPGLWGSTTDERIHHTLARVQSMIGHEGVLVPILAGGRTLAERQQTTPWGERATPAPPVDRPWPGAVPDPLPGTVFAIRHPLEVTDSDGAAVTVSERGMLSAGPARVTSVRGDTRRIIAWAGPWPLDEKWWEPPVEHQDNEPRVQGAAHRVQVVDDTGCGWLLVFDRRGWWTEARYD